MIINFRNMLEYGIGKEKSKENFLGGGEQIWHGKSKEYWVLILQPRWRGPGDKNYLIHALNLDALPISEFLKLAEETGVIGSKSLWVNRRLDIEKLQLDMSSRQFYNSNLKNAKLLGSAYRTYLFDNVVSIRVCDYNFGTSSEDLGIEV